MTPESRSKLLVLAAVGLAGLIGWYLLSAPKNEARIPRPVAQSQREPPPEPLAPRGRGGPPSLISAEPFRPLSETRRDRELRERARNEILRSLGKDKPERTGTSGGPEPAGELDKDYVQRRVREDFLPMAKECYEAALERDGGLAGRMVFRFAIVGDESVGGIVESAELDPSSTLAEDELVTCMRESLSTVTFPPPKRGGRVTVTYPFELTPGDGG